MGFLFQVNFLASAQNSKAHLESSSIPKMRQKPEFSAAELAESYRRDEEILLLEKIARVCMGLLLRSMTEN